MNAKINKKQVGMEAISADVLAHILTFCAWQQAIRLTNKLFRDAYDINVNELSLSVNPIETDLQFSVVSRHALKFTRLRQFGPIHNAFMHHLPLFKNLTSFELDSSSILIDFGYLTQVTKLKSLHICNNEDIGNEGIIALAPAIQELHNLEILRLSFIGMSKKGAEALGPALQKLSKLRELDIHNNPLDVEGVVALAPCFNTLEKLNMRMVTTKGSLCLSKIQTHIKDIKVLDIGLNNIGQDIELFDIALGQLKNLVDLNIIGNNIGEVGFGVIAESLYILQKKYRLRFLSSRFNRLGFNIEQYFPNLSFRT